MDDGISHVCRQCKKPLEPSEPADVEGALAEALMEYPQPPPPAQQAVRKKQKNAAEDPAQAGAGGSEAPTSESSSRGDPETAGGSKAGGARAKVPPALVTGTFSQSTNTTLRLQQIYTEELPPTHPVCVHCTDTLIEKLDNEIADTENEIQDYKDYLEKTEKKDDNEPSLEELRAELERVEAEDERLKLELEEAMAERDAVFRERDLMREEQARLEQSYRKEKKEYSTAVAGWLAAKAKLASLENQVEYQDKQKEMLNELCLPKHIFQIKLKGRIGEINKFKLGKTKSQQTSWAEINCAWGETVFLLDYLARMFNLEFEDYMLMPLRDKSRIELRERRDEYFPLYLMTENSVEQVSKYDQAQVAFTECVSRLEQEIRKKYKNFKLDHPIADGRIYERPSGTSHVIRFGTNSYESWTRALRLLLKNLESMLNLQVERTRTARSRRNDSRR